jgi:hypothetical protein
MYVAASRAKQGLSVAIDDRSALLNGGVDSAYYEAVITRVDHDHLT